MGASARNSRTRNAEVRGRPNHKPYKSKFEKDVATWLHNRGIPIEYERTKIEYLYTHTYTTDFRLPNGIYIEVKGKFDSADRTKHLLIRRQHPELDIRFVFMRDNRIRRTSKTKYSDWCNVNGFKYAIGKIPNSWLRESDS